MVLEGKNLPLILVGSQHVPVTEANRGGDTRGGCRRADGHRESLLVVDQEAFLRRLETEAEAHLQEEGVDVCVRFGGEFGFGARLNRG